MAAKSKFFRVAVEGATTDGRAISREWIQQMAKNYNRAKYGARVFCEHIRGLAPDGPFRALGDVLALQAREITEGDLKGKLALYAQIEPSEALVALTKSGQKIYSSIEVDPDFAKSGEAYLVGQAVTDSPASLGTEVLAFAAQNPTASPFAARKQKPENLFTAGIETTIEIEDESADTKSLFVRVKELLGKVGDKSASDVQRFGDITASIEEMATALSATVEREKTAAQKYATTAAEVYALKAQVEKLAADLAGVQKTLDITPAPHATPRPAATGGHSVEQTDC